MTQRQEEKDGLSARIQRLEDVEAIKWLIVQYARGADRNNDVNILMPLFTDDAWCPYGSGIYFLNPGNMKVVDGVAEFDFFDLNTKTVRKVFVPDKYSNVWRNGISVSQIGRAHV